MCVSLEHIEKCVFKKNNYTNMVEIVWVRVSPASLGSQSWAGHHQGWTGGAEGKKVENWCGGGGGKQVG